MWYQLTGDINLTQAYLARIGAATADICELCLAEQETVGHFTNRCCSFHDTLTKAHNEAWEATTAAIRAKLPETGKLHLTPP